MVQYLLGFLPKEARRQAGFRNRIQKLYIDNSNTEINMHVRARMCTHTHTHTHTHKGQREKERVHALSRVETQEDL